MAAQQIVLRGIISGGQTGVDRGALDAALSAGILTGGWCPRGRAAEDGGIALRYPLTETPSDDPAERTAWNVYDADATLIIADGALSGGTAFTADIARQFNRPFFESSSNGSVLPVLDWLSTQIGPVLLNVAGPRESVAPGIQQRTAAVVARMLDEPRIVKNPHPRNALITGGAGYLGGQLLEFVPPGWRAYGTRRPGNESSTDDLLPVELVEGPQVKAAVDSIRPDVIIHTAYSTVDPARNIVAATRNVVEAATTSGARLIHISSDMVLDGENAPYDEDAPTAPILPYGEYKAEAEHYVRDHIPNASIVRTSLITCFHPPDPRTQWILAGLRRETRVSLFTDEIRSPIFLHDLARQIWEISRLPVQQAKGVWNLAGPDALSRYDIGLLVAATRGLDPAPLRRALSSDADDRRPRDLRLCCARADRQLLTRPKSISRVASDLAFRK